MVSINSFLGNIWNIKTEERVDENNIVDILLKNRGYSQDFMNATMKNIMPDPYLFIDMGKAIKRIYEVITKKQPIAILGDYDVDGICATAIMVQTLSQFGLQPPDYPTMYRIPDRHEEG